MKNCKIAFTLAEVFLPYSASCCKTAFTLAEVLITLGIIGVVAAMTISNLIVRTQEKVLSTQLQKMYSKLSNAMELAQNEYGGINEWEPEDKNYNTMYNMYIERFGKYLNVSKICSNGNDGDFCGDTGRIYKNIDGSSAFNGATLGKSIELSDGSYVSFHCYYAYDALTSQTQYKWWGVYALVTVDVNGRKGPNIKGKDVFRFKIADYSSNWGNINRPKLYPQNHENPEKCLEFSEGGRDCTAWILQYKNMDYTRCATKMKETNTHSCEDAKK